jgi:hypothetical protein
MRKRKAQMKKQINPTIKAHLLRSAHYLPVLVPVLVAICAIQFAPAQQGSKKPAANDVSSGETPVVQPTDGVFRATQVVPSLPSQGTCQYTIAQIGGSIVPGTTDIGNHGDDTVVTIALPFSYTLYDQTFTSINLSSNGNAQFTTTDTTFTNVCLPWIAHNYSIFPYWDDLYLVNSGFGIFTSISGTAPNRIFNIEFRAQYFPGSGTANFELRLYEGQTRFDVIYGTVTNSNTSATAGVQQNDTNFQQYFCNGTGGAATGGQSYILSQPCSTPTPTPTPCIQVTGSIDTGDPTQTDRLFRSGIPQTCPASTTCGNFGDGMLRHYDAYTFTNTTGSTQCVIVDTNTACTGTNFIFIGAYLGTFNPNNICTNWIGDSGGSPNPDQPFSFNLDNGQTVVTVVSEVTPNAGCSAYTLTVNGLCTPTPTPTPSCTPGWRNEPPMANTRRNAATAVVSPNMYAITGFDSVSPYTTANERFDGTTWTTMAPIPVRHAQGRAAAVGTNIYVPGGFNSIDFAGPLNNVQIYSTSGNTWSMGMTLPAARSGVAATAFNNLVYVIGGYNPVGTGHNDVYIYDPGTNSYTTGAPMPGNQGNMPGVLYNGEIYVVGGGTAPGAQFAYNPTTNAWRTIAPIPTAGGTCQSANGFVQDGELWIVGCLSLPINQQVWIYNSGTNMWRAGPMYSVDHQGPGAALFNGRGFVVGGGAAGGGSTAVESVGSCAPTVSSAVSRQTHGAAGTFDIAMPLTGTSGVECRTSGGTSDYSLVVTFSGNVTVTGSPQAQVTSGTGCVGSGGVCTGNVMVSGAVVTVPLTNIANVQVINVRINGVNGAADAPAVNVDIPMGILIGDTNANRTVNAADIAQTKARLGQAVDGTNFRSDVNVNGAINAADVAIIKQHSGTSIP